VPIGMIMGRIDQPLDVAEIVERTVTDAEQTIARLQQRVRSPVV
jgi:hypothetical protein